MNWMIIAMIAQNDDGTSYSNHVKLKFEKLKDKYGATSTLSKVPDTIGSASTPVTVKISIPSARILDCNLPKVSYMDLPNVTLIKRPIKTWWADSMITYLNMPLVTELPNDCFNLTLKDPTVKAGSGVFQDANYRDKFYKVTIFGDRCFMSYTNPFLGDLFSPLLLPLNLKYIGDKCFYKACTETITTYTSGYIQDTIPVTIEHIGAYAFHQFRAINISKLPSNLKYIGDYAFAGTYTVSDDRNKKYVTIIPNNLSYIGSYAFYKWHNLTASNIPTNIAYIGEGAFAETDVTITTWPGKLKTVPSKVFLNCKNITSMTIGNYGLPILSIAFDAFEGCSNLEKIIIYTANGQPLAGAPWGAVNAAITYLPT